MINLILIEDDIAIQQALIDYLNIRPEFNLIASFNSAEEFEQNTVNLTPHIVILDINLPGKSGIDIIPDIKTKFLECSILMLSVNNDNDSVFKSLQAGADGYLGKETALDKIKDAIIELNQGGSPITPAIARKVFDFFNSKQNNLAESLTEREQQIVEGIVAGLSYKLIADKYNISIDTVRKYIKSTYKKLHINSKAELIAKYNGR